MAKNKSIACALLLIAYCLGAVGIEPKRIAVKQVYTSQIGVREATGRNDGVQVENYLRVTKKKRGNAWCAAFVSWCFVEANIKAVRSGWSPAWFPENRLIVRQGKILRQKVPECGDVFGIYFKNKGRIAHVGFIDEWHSKVAITVEGNTNEEGSREGDGVYRKRRLHRQIHSVSTWI